MKIKHLVLSLIAVVAMGCNSDDSNEPVVINYDCFNGISVTTQAELDAVAQTIGPDCNGLNYLVLGNSVAASDITSLASLSKITGIKNIKIQNCPQLTSLEGLHNVRETQNIEISYTAITNLQGLRSLKTINIPTVSVSAGLNYENKIYLHHNSALVNLNGLQKLAAIPSLNLQNCNALQSFHGLENCNEIANLEVVDCPDLTALPTSIQVKLHCYFQRTGIVNLNGLSILSGASVTLFENPSLSSLGNAFENTTTLGHFYSYTNPSLVSLEGLESLTDAGTITIWSNNSLNSISGLQSLLTIDYINIGSNSSLQSISGLQSLTTGSISISYNNLLQSLNGLQSLTTANGIIIEGNNTLTSIEALSSVTNSDRIRVLNNPSLATLNGLQNISGFSGEIRIESNASLKDLCAVGNILPGMVSGSISGNYNPVTLSTLTAENCSIE
ncbi:hypothetical protein ACLI09_14690 [Flavobacterium sp. RHBU_24]|uniref:hypothetical protein n=1 Tax=Flavobacterium sp. RHBU_24 TaxID=3391185 RepID=UPI0039848E74